MYWEECSYTQDIELYFLHNSAHLPAIEGRITILEFFKNMLSIKSNELLENIRNLHMSKNKKTTEIHHIGD